MFEKVEGKTKTMWLPVTTSTVIALNSLVAWDSGYLIAATSTSDPSVIAGVSKIVIAATDSDYADDRLIPVEVPLENGVVWKAAVTSGLVVADRGLYMDLTDAVTVNRAASTYDVVQCLKVLSTTSGHFVVNMGLNGCGVIA